MLALAAAMEAWCAAARALERAFAAGPRWRRRRRRCPAPGWPGAGEEKVEALAVCRSGGAPGQAAVDGPSWMSMLAFNSPPSVEVVRVACPPALHTRQKVSKMRQSSPWLVWSIFYLGSHFRSKNLNFKKIGRAAKVATGHFYFLVSSIYLSIYQSCGWTSWLDST